MHCVIISSQSWTRLHEPPTVHASHGNNNLNKNMTLAYFFHTYSINSISEEVADVIYWLVMGEFMSDYMFFSSHRPVSKIEID